MTEKAIRRVLYWEDDGVAADRAVTSSPLSKHRVTTLKLEQGRCHRGPAEQGQGHLIPYSTTDGPVTNIWWDLGCASETFVLPWCPLGVRKVVAPVGKGVWLFLGLPY